MYRILLATNEPAVLDKLNSSVQWDQLYFKPPVIVNDANSAIQAIENGRIDCVAYLLSKYEAAHLNKYLTTVRPNLPVFEIRRSMQEQRHILDDMRRVLDRLYADTSDEVFDESVVMAMLRDELMHSLLCGELDDEKVLLGRLQMLRSHLSTDRPCIVYEYDMPQGEVYMSMRWHYGTERLENALRSNFFGRYYEDLYYIVAVMTPRHIRIVVCQRDDQEIEPLESMTERADKRIHRVLDDVSEYLGLDMVQLKRYTIENLCALTKQ